MNLSSITMGGLFSGIGGFELASVMNGIKPLWVAEIEPFPCKALGARFPNTPNLGDVTKISGAEIEPVDIITFGSPCQDLSVAGKQLGIHEGQRSNLFFEAIRIIKEMRAADEARGRTGKSIRPRFAVWENVPGAMSSNHGADFQAVLQAFCEVNGQPGDVPMPKKGKWERNGCVVGDGFSIAWKILDAQYSGVAQRRKRIYLIADFGSECAGEILLVSQSVSGYIAESGETREGIAADAERSIGRSCIVFKERAGKPGGGKGILPAVDRAFTLSTNVDQSICYSAAFMGGNGAKARSISYCSDGTTPTLKASPSGGNTVPDVVYTIDHVSSNSMKSKNPHSGFHETTIARTLDTHPDPTCNQGGGQVVVQSVYALQGNGIDRADTAGCNGRGWREDTMYTLNTVDRPAIAFQQNQREEVRDMGEVTGALTANPGVHNQNYVCYPEIARSLCARANSSPCVDRGQNIVVYGIDCRNASLDEEKCHTLQAKANGGISLNCTPSVCYRSSGYGDMAEGVGTLRANGGDAGRGTENIIVERVRQPR